MEAVRRDPEKCTVNPTTWSLTVVSLLYQRPIYSGNYAGGGGGGGGGSVCRYWQFTFLLKN